MNREPSCEPPRRPGRGLLREALLEAFRAPLSSYADLKVAEIGLGRRFLYLLAEEGYLGIAYAPQDEPLPAWLATEPHTLGEVAGYAWSHPVLTSAALAAANAATQAAIEANPGLVDWQGDIAEAVVELKPRRLALVGYIPRLARNLAKKGIEITVYENNPRHRREAEEAGHPTRPGPQLLVEADQYDAILATGASLIDPTLLTARPPGTPLALVGPTSSFHPAIAQRLNIVALGGSHIPRHNRPKLLRLVKAGLGFRRIRHLVEKWTWHRPPEP